LYAPGCYLAFHPDAHGHGKGKSGGDDEPWLPVSLVPTAAEATPFFLVRGTMHDDTPGAKVGHGPSVQHARDVVDLGEPTRIATRVGGKTWWLGEGLVH
jgi:hypothetical protein